MNKYYLYVDTDEMPYENEKFQLICDLLQITYYLQGIILMYNPDDISNIAEEDADWNQYPNFAREKDRWLYKLQQLNLAKEYTNGYDNNINFYYKNVEQQNECFPNDNSLKTIAFIADNNAQTPIFALEVNKLQQFYANPIQIVIENGEEPALNKSLFYINDTTTFINLILQDRCLRYEANHQKHPCRNQNGEYVYKRGGQREWISNQKRPCSNMQFFLNIAVYGGGQMYIYDEKIENFIEFKHTSQNIWHGYHLDDNLENQVPNDVKHFISQYLNELSLFVHSTCVFRGCISLICQNRNL